MALTDKLSAIGEAIREKTGKEELLTLDAMPAEIRAIETSSGDDKYLQLIEGSLSGEIVIPEGITTIKGGAFYDCYNITNFVLPSTLNSIGSYAFHGALYKGEFDFSHFTFTEPVTLLDRAFSGCGIAKLTITENIIYRHVYAYSEMPNLETVIVKKNSDKKFGLYNYAFYRCGKLKTLSLPNTIDGVHGGVFLGCTALEFVTLEQGFAASLNISYSSLYSVETLVAMFEAYADLTGQATQTLTIGVENIAKLTEEQIAILTEKNVTLA